MGCSRSDPHDRTSWAALCLLLIATHQNLPHTKTSPTQESHGSAMTSEHSLTKAVQPTEETHPCRVVACDEVMQQHRKTSSKDRQKENITHSCTLLCHPLLQQKGWGTQCEHTVKPTVPKAGKGERRSVWLKLSPERHFLNCLRSCFDLFLYCFPNSQQDSKT